MLRSCSLSFVSLTLAVFALSACGDLGPVEPAVQQQTKNQLSGGPGVSVYDFMLGGERVGTVMVTDGVSANGFPDQTEFWLWDDRTTDKLRDGKVDDLAIEVAFQDSEWKPEAAQIFENDTSGWVSYSIPRLFELRSEPRKVKEDKRKERFVYRMTAPAWGGVDAEIRYYLEIDFEKRSDIPTMEWLVDADDLKAYYYSEMYDVDADDDMDEDWTMPAEAAEDVTRWEVRLTQDTELEKVKDAEAYELTTLYPAE